jgi:hypothetical protein
MLLSDGKSFNYGDVPQSGRVIPAIFFLLIGLRKRYTLDEKYQLACLLKE